MNDWNYRHDHDISDSQQHAFVCVRRTRPPHFDDAAHERESQRRRALIANSEYTKLRDGTTGRITRYSNEKGEPQAIFPLPSTTWRHAVIFSMFEALIEDTANYIEPSQTQAAASLM